MQNRRWGLRVVATVAVVFGLLTVASGGRALFGDAAARAAVGDAVPFVLWFNFLAGFAYVGAGIGLFLQRRWAVHLSIAILVATALVMIAFWVHVALGGAYEVRTAGAMGLRTAVWVIIVAVARRKSAKSGFDAAQGGGRAPH
ncbi:MAG: hypothetical protein QNK42_03235 [Pseudodonghicola sp.]|nr:hypothetical protein [Pseudodonghicola sp.]